MAGTPIKRKHREEAERKKRSPDMSQEVLDLELIRHGKELLQDLMGPDIEVSNDSDKLVPVDDAMRTQALTLIRSGWSLRRIAEHFGRKDHKTIAAWFLNHDKWISEYRNAQQVKGYMIFEEMIKIAYDFSIPPDHKRILVDTLKFASTKLFPKMFGDDTGAGGVNLKIGESGTPKNLNIKIYHEEPKQEPKEVEKVIELKDEQD